MFNKVEEGFEERSMIDFLTEQNTIIQAIKSVANQGEFITW